MGIVASDPTVAQGLRRLFARRAEVEEVAAVAPPAPDGARGEPRAAGAPEADFDLLVLDVWPPSTAAAEEQCARWHARQPGAAIVAIVHHLTPGVRARLTRAGCTALWPKDGVRDLPAFAVGLVAGGRSPA